MRFSDGKIRLATVRLALLRRVWALLPEGILESSQALHEYEGGDVLDIGAYHGWYSVLLAPKARPGDRLVSFEPDPRALPVLRAMLEDLGRRFPSLGLSVVDQPVGDGANVGASWPESGVLHPRFAAADESGAVPSLTVDEYVLAHTLRPRLVKVDVEGAELAVLDGMQQTLSTHRPTLMLEIHPGWQPEGVVAADVESFLRAAGYEGTTLDDQPISRRQVWVPQATVPAPA